MNLSVLTIFIFQAILYQDTLSSPLNNSSLDAVSLLFQYTRVKLSMECGYPPDSSYRIDTCIGRCGESRYNKSELAICYCDFEMCEMNGDCCYDYYMTCNPTISPPVYRCVPPHFYTGFINRFTAVSSCKETLKDTVDGVECITDRKSSIRHNLPVIGSDDDTYRNEYCARCNGRTVQKYFKIEVECTNQQSCYDAMDPTLSSIQQLESLIEKPGAKLVLYAPSSFEVTYCEGVESCPDSEKWPLNATLCLQYAAFVVKNAVTYKNPHCAECNGVELDNRDVCTSTSGEVGNRDPPSLVILFNINEGSNNEVSKTISCVYGELYDPFRRVCVPYQGWEYLKDIKADDIVITESNKTCLEPQTDITNTTECYWLVENNTRVNQPGLENMTDVQYTLIKVGKNTEASGTQKLCIDTPRGNDDLSDCGSYLKINTSHYRRKDRENNMSVFYYEVDECLLYRESTYVCLSPMTIVPHIPKCSKFLKLQHNEYVIFPNQSILVFAHNKFYHNGTYVISGQVAFLCVTFETFYEVKIPFSNPTTTAQLVEQYLTMTCFILSIIFLLFLLVTYTIFQDLRTLPGCNVMALSLALMISQILFLAGAGGMHDQSLCTAVAILLHYLFLTSFGWMCVMAYNVHRAFSRQGQPRDREKKTRTFMTYCLAASGIPLAVVVPSVVVDRTKHIIGYGTGQLCWIENPMASLIVFALPVLIIIIFNTVSLIKTVISLHESHKISSQVNSSMSVSHQAKTYLKLSTLMGLTWILGFGVAFEATNFLKWPFIVLNGLQGVFICVSFALTNKKVWKSYKRFYGVRHEGTSTTGQQSGYTSRNLATIETDIQPLETTFRAKDLENTVQDTKL